MAAEQRILEQEGYLSLGFGDYSHIAYHPLNVIVAFGSGNVVKILDVHSGAILQTYNLGVNSENGRTVCGRYMQLQDKVLFWDGHNLGLRGDYNGVLLLDTIMQSRIMQHDDLIKLELLLAEAVIFQTSLNDLEQEGLECPSDVSNELTEKIKQAQSSSKRGIKAQRWNTICLEVSYSSLKLVANNVVIMLKRRERHIPALAIASAINERLTDLLSGPRVPERSWVGSHFQRVLMHSEAVRRQTFEKWPHMDYKWALPDQMAQAGFYHQPSASGEDRAMCFTCSVCLVCWEKTDEPWSEHERHSPMCPFVKGEYTQNVPLSVTYATNPAITAPGLGFDVISNSDYANVLCTSCSQTGDITIWSIERHLKQMHTFNIASLMKDVCDESYEWVRVTAICVLPNGRAQSKINVMQAAQSGSTGGCGRSTATGQCTSTSTLRAGVVGSKVVLGLSIQQTTGEHLLRMVVLNIVESDRVVDVSNGGDVGIGNGVVGSSSNIVAADGGIAIQTTPKNQSIGSSGSGSGGSGGGGVSSGGGAGDGLMESNGGGSSSSDKQDDRYDDNKSMNMNMFEKYGFVEAGNGFASGLGKLDDIYLSQMLKQDFDTVWLGSSPATTNDFEMDSTSFKKKLVAQVSQHAMNNNNNNNNSNINNNNGNGHVGNNDAGNGSLSKMTVSEEIDCVVESCTIVKRMNALASTSSGSTGVGSSTGGSNDEIIEIAEIMPTNGTCNQLLVKLLKIRTPVNEGGSKIIMATVEDLDDERMEEHVDLNSDAVAAQLLIFDCIDAAIFNEYTLAVTFSAAKCPRQLCIIPSMYLNTDRRRSGSGERSAFDAGALCVVCADGTIEVYSLNDFQPIVLIEEENEHFVSVAYCRSLDRLCGCTKSGALFFYSLNDAENESGDEMLEMDEDSGIIEPTSQQSIAPVPMDVTVTDGNSDSGVTSSVASGSGVIGTGDGDTTANAANNQTVNVIAEQECTTPNAALLTAPTIRIDCNVQTTANGGGNGNVNGGVIQSSPSPSSTSMTVAAANLLANKIGELTLDDLQTLYALTQFDDVLTVYTAEVPSCWNDLVQAQKKCKQPQNLRHGDDAQFTKTWRLHNDATTWDEHIIELSLAQPVNLGHIDLKFTLFQQCHNPAAIQVTLLKHNTSGFGYRMKHGSLSHSAYKQTANDDNADSTTNNGGNDAINENPVLNEEYLQTHNAEILAGPIELSSCIDLCDQGGTVMLTSPKLFKTRSRNFLLHIKTMSDPAKEGQTKTRVTVPVEKHCIIPSIAPAFVHHCSANHLIVHGKKTDSYGNCKCNCSKGSKHARKKENTKPKVNEKASCSTKQSPYDFYIGCDWLHEISISVRGVKPQIRIPNERLQRIAMLESNVLLENLLRIVSNANATELARKLALDILTWICCIRLNRFRSPKSERVKGQINKTTAAGNSDLLAQQFECICLTEKYLEDTVRNCIIRSNRSMAHKCVKLILLLTDGMCSLPPEVQVHSTLDITIKNAIANTFNELPQAQYASVVRWYAMLSCVTATLESHNGISELCVQLLTEISKEIDNRWDPYCALLSTRFGLYDFPFEPEIFDYDLPNVNRSNMSLPSTLMNIIRSNAGLMQAAGMDIKKLCSIDGVDFRTFPHLIKCKSVSNQLRGLLEVEQLHFTCVATSEATRIDNMDSVSASSSSNINMEEIIVAPMQPNSVDVHKDQDNETIYDLVNNVHNLITDTQLLLGHSKKLENDANAELKPNGIGPFAPVPTVMMCTNPNDAVKFKPKALLPKFQAICQYIEYCDENSQNATTSAPSKQNANSKSSVILDKLPKVMPPNIEEPVVQPEESKSNAAKSASNTNTTASASSACTENAPTQAPSTNIFAWHKLLAPPPKQMVVIDRMHSGARRFVVLDFGSPVLLTDLVIPACDELAYLHIDIWCFDEEADSVRLVVASDIGVKTLVLSDLQPPPICRFMKITIIGRIGMSSTKCKIPIGSFYGHAVILESDGYGDNLLRYVKHPSHNTSAQVKALNALYEDVHCRYSLASGKLMELLMPILNCELSNVAHMQAFINKQREDDGNSVDNSKIITIYEECIMLQHQINVIRNVINRLEPSHLATALRSTSNGQQQPTSNANLLRYASRDKLRVLGQNLIEILLHFSIEYGIKNILPVHQLFTMDVANMLFNSLVVYGDAHIQLATCSLLVRMCCFQSWWGDFLADIFCNLFSSQNSKIFPQDRIFFLLTYLGRRSIAMGTCRSIVIDAVLKTLAKLLASISPYCQAALWSKFDLQLITWLLLFLSVCLDDSNERKDKSANRWDFMSCESDFTKTRAQASSSSGKQLRCYKKRIIQQNKYGVQPYTDWGKKIFMIQNEHPGIFMELTGKPKVSKSIKANVVPKASSKEVNQETENNFDKGLKTIRLNNILIVIRGLIALLLEMDFTCNMDQFLLTCKVIARLVSACRPTVQLSRIVTTTQLQLLIRLAVWNDQQQPWAVHAITCLLQDLLDADKHYKDNDATPTNDGVRPMDGVTETKDIFNDFPLFYVPPTMNSMQSTSSDVTYAEAVKCSYLPSLIECEDMEIDDILNDIDILDRGRPTTKKDNTTLNKTTFNYFCKSISSAMDARLESGLDLNVEIHLRRLTMISSVDMYSSLPQILANEFITAPAEAKFWPEYITDIWSGPEYDSGQNTYTMFKNVFDCIFADLHVQDTWVHLEQVLHMWLTLNGELSDKPLNAGPTQNEVPKIPFGASAVQGLLLALAWHNDIKLRTWCLGFQCLFLACNSQPIGEDDTDTTRINEVIVNDENFEKMLLRFFSGYGMSSSIITNRCAGPTICKHLHELLLWLYKKSEASDGPLSCKRKLKDILLHVILQLVQPGGAISNQQGPIDAQSQLVRDLLYMPNDKGDLNVSLNIIESVSFLVFNHISNGDKLQCQRSSDTNNTSNTFSSLFANVLGSENTKQNTSISDNSLLISLLKLSSSLIQTELPRQPSEMPIPEEEELSCESQTDETKAEQLSIEGYRAKTPCIADTVLRHFPTMKRLLGSLSHCTSASFTPMASTAIYSVKSIDSSFLLDEPQTAADAVFNMLITLCDKASNPRLVVAPICQYLEASTLQRNALPRLQLSEPFLWYISKVLEVSSTVNIFTQLGGVQIICKNLVNLNKILINMQAGLISLVMQHMTRNTKLKLHSHACASSSSKKSAASVTQAHRNLHDGLINFAPFCSITSENDTAQSADILILNPVASHRRPRTPAWSYMFYPNESHVDLTITLPTAILLKEVQLQPHTPTLASCPSAVAMEISRDYGLGPIPIGAPLTTTGMTCIRLKLSKPEIATSIVLRLYRPKDSPNIGLTQIAILGNTIFGSNSGAMSGGSTNPGGCSTSSGGSGGAYVLDQANDEDTFAKTSVGWVRILARCFNVASLMPRDSKLATDVIGASAQYPGFLDACCSLMNIMPMIPNAALQNLETVLLNLGSYSRDLCLQLIRTLLNATPQTYKLSNESICDLLYELATAKDSYTCDKIEVLIDWIMNLRAKYSLRALRCNNPQSGFIKCIASIIWTVGAENPLCCLPISTEVLESCLEWIDALENEEPLKVAFDSLLCSLCYIKPQLFDELLVRFKVELTPTSEGDAANDTEDAATSNAENCCGVTDDNKEASGSEWFANVAAENLKTLLQRPAYLNTLAMACQSPLAIYQLIDSGLPKLLAHALYEYCSSMLDDMRRNGTADAATSAAAEASMPSTSATAAASGSQQAAQSEAASTSAASCLTDADKAVHNEERSDTTATSPPLLSSALVPKILDFFTECCAEGHMRNWLGTKQGTIFWKALLELLCNCRPINFVGDEPMQQAFIRIERATINFFTRATACHPKNQVIFTTLLISVIRKPPTAGAHSNGGGNNVRTTISGFTRQIVLQLLLENERFLVSVRSKQPLQKRDTCMASVASTSAASAIGQSSISVSLVNHHPSKRINAHHLLFSVSTNTKCQEILQNCISDTRQADGGGGGVTTSSISNMSSSNGSELKHDNNNDNNNKTNGDAFNNMGINFNGHGMEFLSVAAGVTAKDKRLKDVKNQVAANKDNKEIFPNFSKLFNIEDFLTPSNASSISNCAQLTHPDCPDILISSDTTVSQILAALHSKGYSLSTPCLTLNLVPGKLPSGDDCEKQPLIKAANVEPLPSPLQRFSHRGGLSLLAQYLPTVFPESAGRKTPTSLPEKEKSPPMTDWVKLEPNEEIYEDLEDPITEPVVKSTTITSVPQHSLAAFGLFLRLPAYSDVLLRDKLRAQCLLRLVLGVTGDGEGNDIYSLSLAPSLPTLPFEVFRQLLDSLPLTTDDGMLLRRMVIEVGAMHLVLNCLGIFTHQSQNYQVASPLTEVASGGIKPAAAAASAATADEYSLLTSDDKSHTYWAKGTGFGTGSTAQSWNVEQALLRQKSEEEHVTVLLQVLSSYINPGDKIPSALQADEIMPYLEIKEVSGELPGQFLSLLQQSCLLPALSSYLRNDSVLDITRHIPLYRAILQLLRALSLSQQLVSLLQPQQPGESSPSIAELLANMKSCVDTYAKRLKLNKKSNIKGQTQQVTVNIDDGDDEGLALLIPDIQETTMLVQKTTNANALANQERLAHEGGGGGGIDGSGSGALSSLERPPQTKSIELRYLEVMKKLQFDTFEMIVESEGNGGGGGSGGFRFIISHHFEKMVRMAGDRYHPSRVKRLAQEAVTLSTSLPLSYSSSVFVRCDTDRLDIMKVLITGPADTPYANGCFEFDVFFPPDYPNLPMLINLETTGRHSVRFNPNLYNDGKVCLSVLNTWHGRPEEKWNAKTSSFLQVLVSIQSLILVPEPYFNEPGFERSRGTPSGTHSSREYNSNIYQACVRWAMLEQIRNPSPCFKDVIHTHFWLKRNEICAQIENWIDELSKPQTERNSRTISFNSMVLRRQYRHLREELAKLPVPEGLEDLETPFNPNVTLPAMSDAAAAAASTEATTTTATTTTAATTTVASSTKPAAAAAAPVAIKEFETMIDDCNLTSAISSSCTATDTAAVVASKAPPTSSIPTTTTTAKSVTSTATADATNTPTGSMKPELVSILKGFNDLLDDIVVLPLPESPATPPSTVTVKITGVSAVNATTTAASSAATATTTAPAAAVTLTKSANSATQADDEYIESGMADGEMDVDVDGEMDTDDDDFMQALLYIDDVQFENSILDESME